MRNEEGETVDLYIPRKCSWTNRLVTSKDHAAIQVRRRSAVMCLCSAVGFSCTLVQWKLLALAHSDFEQFFF